MEENDDHGLNLSLTLKCLSPPPPSSSTPPSQYHPSELPQIFLQKFTRVPYNLHTLLPPDHPLRHTPPIHNPYAEMDKEIEACIEEKRRRKAELKERVREHLRERAQRRQMEEEVAVVVSSPPNSAVSTASLSGNKRKEREENNVEEEEKDLSSKYIVISEDEEDGGGDAAAEAAAAARKKLMLSKEQAVVLEETFKKNNTLTNKEKVALAKQLDLRPRQVEVWFQNRRARTKLKQTEVDYGYLKTCCEVIGEENRHLKKELIELRALKHSYQSYVNMFPPTTLIMCSHCARVTTSSSSSSSTRTACVTGAVNTNHQDLVSPSRPKSTSGIPFAKLISSEALDVRRPRP